MFSGDADTKFNWTTDEMALLQHTLHVRMLGDDRIEVAGPSAEWESLRGILVSHVIFFWFIAVLAFLLTAVGSEGLEIKPWVLCVLLVLGAMVSVGLSRALAPTEPMCPVSLFPGTPWCIHHGLLQDSLDRIAPPGAPVPDYPGRSRMVAFGSDVGGVWLRTRRSASDDDLERCRAVLLGRCTTATANEDRPPPSVARTLDDEILRTPRPLYISLLRNLQLESLSSHTIVLRGGHASNLVPVLIATAYLSLPLLFLLIPAWASQEAYYVLGTSSTARLWQVVLIVMFSSLTLAQTGLLARYYQRRYLGTITISKHRDYVLYRSGLTEVNMPKPSCTVSTGPDAFESDEIVDRDSVFFCHGRKLVARWILQKPASAADGGKALVARIREYMDNTHASV